MLHFQVLKDVGELINLTLIQAQNYQSLSGSTTFNRIEIPTSSDPLNGDFYIRTCSFFIYLYIHLATYSTFFILFLNT